MTSESKSNNICELCSELCTNQCGNCFKVSYCSRSHQLLDRKDHKRYCFPAFIETNEILGRHLLASREIKQGEVIIKEKPILCGPNGKSGLHPICLSCFKKVDPLETCQSCKWPLHAICQNDPNHKLYECKIFSSNSMSSFSLREIHMYEKILLLRGVLSKEVEPEKWGKILKLESNREERHNTRRGEMLSNSAVEFIQKTCALSQFTAKEIDHVLGAISTNAFSTEDNLTQSPHFRSGTFLYEFGSIPAHDCTPSAKWTINSKGEFNLIALRKIMKNEPITQLYTEALVGTLSRRSILKESKYFDCSCKRCADPTENDSYFSAIKCTGYSSSDKFINEELEQLNMTKIPCSGFLLPQNPLDQNSNWACSNDSCSQIQTLQGVETLVSHIQNEINKTSETEPLEKLIKRYSGLLHPNHFLIHEMEQRVMQNFSYSLHLGASEQTQNKKSLKMEQSLKKQELRIGERLIELSKKALALIEKLTPGNTTHKGRQLYFLQQGLGILIQNKINLSREKVKISSKSKQKKSDHKFIEMKEEIIDFLKIREEGAKILTLESEAREEFILAQKMSGESFDENFKNIMKFFELIK